MDGGVAEAAVFLEQNSDASTVSPISRMCLARLFVNFNKSKDTKVSNGAALNATQFLLKVVPRLEKKTREKGVPRMPGKA